MKVLISLFLLFAVSCREKPSTPNEKIRKEFDRSNFYLNAYMDSSIKYLPADRRKATIYYDSARYFLGRTMALGEMLVN